jgi:hypothetical protein
VRAWTVIILLSCALYGAHTGGPLGWFGALNPVNALVAQATLANLGLEVVVAENGRRIRAMEAVAGRPCRSWP